MRVLLLDAGRLEAWRAQEVLRQEHIIVDTTDNGEDALILFRTNDYDVIVLDLRLQEADGFEVIRRLREAKSTVPILVCSRIESIADLLRAFRMGADDFLEKPYDSRELVARLRALMRRMMPCHSSVVAAGNLELDVYDRRVKVSEIPLELTRMEFGVLELLMRHRGHTIAQERMLTSLYEDGAGDRAALHVFVCRLRSKLRLAGWNGAIETVQARGYCILNPKSDVAVPLLAEIRAA